MVILMKTERREQFVEQGSYSGRLHDLMSMSVPGDLLDLLAKANNSTAWPCVVET